PGRLGVLRGAASDGTGGRLLHQRRRGEVRLADVQEDHGPLGVRDIPAQGRRRLGHLHHVERSDALGAGGDFHGGLLGAARRGPHPSMPFVRLAATSAARRVGARPLSTPFTYLWPSVPPNSLASSMHSFSTTRQGTSRQCLNSYAPIHITPCSMGDISSIRRSSSGRISASSAADSSMQPCSSAS